MEEVDAPLLKRRQIEVGDVTEELDEEPAAPAAGPLTPASLAASQESEDEEDEAPAVAAESDDRPQDRSAERPTGDRPAVEPAAAQPGAAQQDGKRRGRRRSAAVAAAKAAQGRAAHRAGQHTRTRRRSAGPGTDGQAAPANQQVIRGPEGGGDGKKRRRRRRRGRGRGNGGGGPGIAQAVLPAAEIRPHRLHRHSKDRSRLAGWKACATSHGLESGKKLRYPSRQQSLRR